MNTRQIGKVYLRFDELPSTNEYALHLLETTPAPQPGDSRVYAPAESAKPRPAEGTVIRTASQSAGRGQYGSHWASAPGQNLLLSVILYPTWLRADQQFGLSIMAALSLHDAAEWAGRLSPVNATPLLKWPNDLYYGQRKAAGILIQNALLGTQVQGSVVGIGLNVNQTSFDPALPNPTSLALTLGQPFDLDALAAHLLERLELRYAQLRAGHWDSLRAEYHQHLLGFGQQARYRCADGEQLEAEGLGVTPEGRLRLRTADQQERTFGFKEIAPIWP